MVSCDTLLVVDQGILNTFLFRTKYLESESIDKYSSPQEIVFKLSTGRAAMREAEIRAEKLERELEERNAREEEQTKMVIRNT